MGIHTIETSEHKKISQKSNSSRKSKHTPQKKNNDQAASRKDRNKLMALQDALQDPITHCEEF